MFFEKIIKSQIDIPLNQETYDEAGNFAKKYLEKLETHLAGNPYLAGEKFSVADVVGFAYVEQTKAIDFSLNDYPNVVDWFNKVESRPSIAKAKARLPHE
jgi:glutathione S-transferase